MFASPYGDNEAPNMAAEDERVSLMRKFVDLSDALERERQTARERDEKIAALSAELERLRDTLHNALGSNQTQAMPQHFVDEMKRAY